MSFNGSRYRIVLDGGSGLAVALAVWVCLATGASASERIALVVGVDRYDNIPSLANAVSDAKKMKDALESVNPPFHVHMVLDPTLAEFEAEIRRFGEVAEAPEMVTVYFAGHGIEFLGEDFLLLADADVSEAAEMSKQSARQTRDELLPKVAVPLRGMISEFLEPIGAEVTWVIIDACRDDPTDQSVGSESDASDESLEAPDSGGLFVESSSAVVEVVSEGERRSTGAASGGRVQSLAVFSASGRSIAGGGGSGRDRPPGSTLVSYSASLGEVALDGLYTDLLVEILEQPNLTLPILNARVRGRLPEEAQRRLEGHKQNPVELGNLSEAATLYIINRPSRPELPEVGHFGLSELYPDEPMQGWSDYGKRELLKRVQRILEVSADGGIGPLTQNALIDWQVDQGLAVTGRLDMETLSKMGLESVEEARQPATSTASSRDRNRSGSSSGGGSRPSPPPPPPPATTSRPFIIP